MISREYQLVSVPLSRITLIATRFVPVLSESLEFQSLLSSTERDRELQRFTACRVVGRDDVDGHFGLLWHNCRGGGLPAIFDMKLFAQRAGVEWRGGLGWDGILW